MKSTVSSGMCATGGCFREKTGTLSRIPISSQPVRGSHWVSPQSPSLETKEKRLAAGKRCCKYCGNRELEHDPRINVHQHQRRACPSSLTTQSRRPHGLPVTSHPCCVLVLVLHDHSHSLSHNKALGRLLLGRNGIGLSQ